MWPPEPVLIGPIPRAPQLPSLWSSATLAQVDSNCLLDKFCPMLAKSFRVLLLWSELLTPWDISNRDEQEGVNKQIKLFQSILDNI